MDRNLSVFSNCGNHFVSCGSDGKLKLWDTQTGTLKQEFVPNLHLNTPSTCLVWISLDDNSSPWKNRKRKLENKKNKMVVIGTSMGTIAVFSLTEGKVVSTLKGGLTSPINCMSWSEEGGLFSCSQSDVIHWDISNKSVKSKWKCGKGKITSILVSPKGDLCVTACFTLKLWEVKTQTLLKSVTGHSTDVTSMVFINEQYILSAAANDRHLCAWSISGDCDDPVGVFVMKDYTNTGISVSESVDGLIHVAAATRSGSVQIFQHQLNGKCGKPVKPKLTVEISTSGAKVSMLPIISILLTSYSSAWIAYGCSPKYQFECIDIGNVKEKRLTLVRSESIKPLVNTLKVGESMSENVEYVNGGVKRKGEKKVDVPMEERLGNLSIDQAVIGSTSKPSSHNMAQLLIQGLESKDKSILESILLRRDPLVINETVSRLPLHALGPLIKELINMLHGKTLASAIGAMWLKTVVGMHASHLLADSETCAVLTRMHSLLETRLLVLPSLMGLTGRLDLLLQQLEEPTQQTESNTNALLIYQDEDSSDEVSSFYGEAEVSDSEDLWEEESNPDFNSEEKMSS